MKHILVRGRRASARRHRSCRLQLEPLEARLPLGDALLSTLLTSSWLGSNLPLRDPGLVASKNAFGDERPAIRRQPNQDTGPAQILDNPIAALSFSGAPPLVSGDRSDSPGGRPTGTVERVGAIPAWEAASVPGPEWATLAALTTAQSRLTKPGLAETDSAVSRGSGTVPSSGAPGANSALGLAPPLAAAGAAPRLSDQAVLAAPATQHGVSATEGGLPSPVLPRHHQGGPGVQDAGCAGSWSPAPDMAEARGFYSMTLLDDGRVLVAGGFQQAPSHALRGAEIFDPSSDTWTRTGDLVGARAGQAAVKLADGRVLVAGGYAYNPDESAFILRSAEIYDPDTGTWTPTASMNVARTEPVLTLLPDGRVFISGGTRGESPGLDKSAEIYDPGTGQWTRVADMSTSRSDHIQVLLDDGRVLVAGGFRDTLPAPGAFFATAEIYNPRTDTWTPTGSMHMPRADGESALLRDGRVLITGGNTQLQPRVRTATAETYDPATGTWTLTGGTMTDPKVDHAVTLLQDGTVLVVGGVRSADNPVASADIYDPVSESWTPVPFMVRARHGIFAVTLDDGRVLVAGGLNFDPDTPPQHALARAELFACQEGSFTSFDFPDARDTLAYRINPRGDIVGQYFSAGGVSHGFVLSGGSFTSIDVPGAIFTTSHAITPRGDIVGAYDSADHVRHSYLLSGGSFTSFDPPGAVFSSANGISPRGDIVGSYNRADGVRHGYLLSGDSFTSFDFPGATFTTAQAINPRGDIVGLHALGGTVHGFLLSGDGFTSIDFPGARATEARGVNPRGDIVGPYTGAGSRNHGYLLSGDSFTSIDFPGARATEAWGINPRGDIVGFYSDAGGKTHGFLER